MIALIQRVDSAKVTVVDSPHTKNITKGLVIFLGIKEDDTAKDIEYIVKKLKSLKFFADKKAYFTKTVQDQNAQLLVISQFTLYADLTKGTKPSFTKAMEPIQAEFIYEQFCAKLIKEGFNIQTGVFRAHMKIQLINDGPVTFTLSSDHLKNEH